MRQKSNGAVDGATKKTTKNVKNKKIKDTKIFKILRIILIIAIIIVIINIIKGFSHKTPSEISVVIRDKKIKLEHEIVIDENNNIFMSIDDVKNLYDINIFYSNKTLITTYNKHIAVLEMEKTTMKVNDVVQEIKGTLKEINGIVYLPLSDLQDVYDFEENYNKETKVVSIDSKSIEKKEAIVLKNASLKESTDTFAKTIENVKKSEYVCVFEANGKFTKVRTRAGNVGYIQTNKLSKPEVVWENMDEEDLNSVNVLENYNNVDDYEVLSNVLENSIVLPNLFSISQNNSDEITVNTLIDLEGEKFTAYKNWADKSKITICPTITLDCNMSKISSSYETRSYVINILYNELIKNKLTMICVDFEEIDDTEGLYRFITEMMPRFKCAGMKVLIKNNSILNKDRLNNIVDIVL